jgi:hypothetical protein
MLFFRGEEHVQRWCDARELERGAMLPPAQAWRLAVGWYWNKLQPEWRRHTPEQAETLLQSIGLTGEFWKLRG